MLFGDSITEQSFGEGGFGTALAELVLSHSLHTRKDELQAAQMGGTRATTVGEKRMRVMMVPILGEAFGGNYSFLVWDDEDPKKRAIVVDPADPQPVLRAAEAAGLSVEVLLTTHWHFDHSGGNCAFRRALPELEVVASAHELGRTPAVTSAMPRRAAMARAAGSASPVSSETATPRRRRAATASAASARGASERAMRPSGVPSRATQTTVPPAPAICAACACRGAAAAGAAKSWRPMRTRAPSMRASTPAPTTARKASGSDRGSPWAAATRARPSGCSEPRWTEAAMDPRDVQEIFCDVSSRDASPVPRRLVYLSPDAEEVLEDVEEDTAYVIGGIVDLAARGVAWSLPKATALGIRTARLPIRENLPSVTNQILNIDTALKVLCEKYSGKDWEEALRAALPTRQQGERPARKNRPLVGEAKEAR